jgi:hypothetical protein
MFLAGSALIGVGIAEAGTAQDIWANAWFDIGLPLSILALAMGVHAVALAHSRHHQPTANGTDRPDGPFPAALPVLEAPHRMPGVMLAAGDAGASRRH